MTKEDLIQDIHALFKKDTMHGTQVLYSLEDIKNRRPHPDDVLYRASIKSDGTVDSR